MAGDPHIEESADPGSDPDIRRMLVELGLAEQAHYDHPQETGAELHGRLRPEARFTGENHLFVARSSAGRGVGLCWVVLFDPGTGLEAEVAELFVEPEFRGAGVGARLLAAAMRLIRERHVTFASVWTRHDNAAAIAAYRTAGFRPTEQAVLTWLPLPPPGEPG